MPVSFSKQTHTCAHYYTVFTCKWWGCIWKLNIFQQLIFEHCHVVARVFCMVTRTLLCICCGVQSGCYGIVSFSEGRSTKTNKWPEGLSSRFVLICLCVVTGSSRKKDTVPSVSECFHELKAPAGAFSFRNSSWMDGWIRGVSVGLKGGFWV